MLGNARAQASFQPLQHVGTVGGEVLGVSVVLSESIPLGASSIRAVGGHLAFSRMPDILAFSRMPDVLPRRTTCCVLGTGSRAEQFVCKPLPL
eukprot:649709-Prorocentrum_minimum.AAC.1